MLPAWRAIGSLLTLLLCGVAYGALVGCGPSGIGLGLSLLDDDDDDDPTPSITAISGPDPRLTNLTEATFTFRSNRKDLRFRASLASSRPSIDLGVVTSPKRITVLESDTYRFILQVVDGSGRVQATSEFEWIVDLEPPSVVPLLSDDYRAENDREAPEFEFTAFDQNGVDMVEGRLLRDGEPVPGPMGQWQQVASPFAATVDQSGGYAIEIRAFDKAGNSIERPLHRWAAKLTHPDGDVKAVGRPLVVGRGPESVVTADFNGDAIADLATANIDDDTISVLLGNGSDGRGNATFVLSGHYPAGDRPVSIIKGDFNDDAIVDLAVGNSNDGTRVSLLLGGGSDGVGDGTFSDPYPYESGVRRIRSIVAGDFNQDRIVDLAVCGDESNGPWFGILHGEGAAGRGDGRFDERAVLRGDFFRFVQSGELTGLATGDFINSDDAPDLLAVNPGTSEAGGGILWTGLPTALDSGQRVAFFVPRPIHEGVAAVATGDFDNDGATDVLLTNPVRDEVSVLPSKNRRICFDFQPFDVIRDFAVEDPGAPVVRDFDQDGILDVATTRGAGGIWMLRGAGENGRGEGRFFAPDALVETTEFSAMTAGEFNGDGITDLAATDRSGGVAIIMIGTGGRERLRGDGRFGAPVTRRIDLLASRPRPGDFDGDGITDFIVVAETVIEHTVSVFRGNGRAGRGDSTFAETATYRLPSTIVDVGTGDFNGDRVTDLVVVTAEAPGLGLLLGRGDGSFRAFAAAQVGGAALGDPDRVLVADLDGDRIEDLIVRDGGSGRVSVLLGTGDCNRGAAAFVNGDPVDAGIDARAFAVGDFDRNRIVDLAIAGATRDAEQSARVAVLSGRFGPNGHYELGPPTVFRAADDRGDNVRDLLVGDWDRDGIEDLAVLVSRNGVATLRGRGQGGRGDGTFVAGVLHRVNPASGQDGDVPMAHLVAGDFDANGIVDFVLGYQDIAAGKVAVLRGTGGGARWDGGFIATGLYATGGAQQDPTGLAVGDFDANGAVDILVTNGWTNSLAILPGLGTTRPR